MNRVLSHALAEHPGQEVVLKGWLSQLRRLRTISFLVLRDRSGTAQVLLRDPALIDRVAALAHESVLEVRGQVAPRGDGRPGVELQGAEVEVLSQAHEPPPFDLFRPDLELPLPTLLDYAPLSLRHPRRKAVFEIAGAAAAGFRESLRRQAFVEIHTPKIVAAATEGGANVFPVAYFDKTAYLAQSPQFYKQMMVGVFERVFEVGPVFRAEPHDTPRHLNEYVSLDAEMGFIDDHRTVMGVLRDVIAGMLEAVAAAAGPALALLDTRLPDVPSTFPRLHFTEAHELIAHARPAGEEPLDLAPADELRLGGWARREFASDFLVVEGYPVAARPFYTHPDPERPGYTRGFDLLFRGGGACHRRTASAPLRGLPPGLGPPRPRPGPLRPVPPGVPLRHAAARRVRHRSRALRLEAARPREPARGGALPAGPQPAEPLRGSPLPAPTCTWVQVPACTGGRGPARLRPLRMAPRRRRRTMGIILRYRGFRAVWLGQLFSQFGNAVFLIMALWEIQLRQPELLSIAGVAMVVPTLLAAVGGVFADRHHPGRLMLWTDVLRGVAVALGLVFLLLPGSLDFVTISLIAVNSLGAALFGPAEMVVIPRLVEVRDLAGANGMYNLTYQISSAVGAAIGGAAIVAIGVAWVFGFDMVSFWISAAAILLMLRTFTWAPKAPDAAEGAAQSFSESLREGFAALRRLPVVLPVLPAALAINFAFMAAFTMLPYWVHHVLGTGAVGYGMIDAAWAAGMVLGSLLVGRFGAWALRTSMLLMFGGQSLLLFLFPFAGSAVAAAALLLLAGTANGIGNALTFAMLQRMTPEELRGRVFGVVFTLFGLANPLGSLAAGLALHHVPLAWSWFAAGAAGIWLGAAIWRHMPADLAGDESLQVDPVSG